MTARRYQLRGRTYLFGATWTTPPREVRLAAAAREYAERGTLVCLRRGVHQIGVSAARDREDGGIPGLRPWFSAAAVLAERLPGAWLGAWPLADGRVYVVAVSATGILPDGDRLCLDVADARRHFDVLRSNGSYRRVYAPESWGIPNSTVRSLEDALSGERGPRFTRPPARLSIVPLTAAAAAVVLAYYGVEVARLHLDIGRSAPPPRVQTTVEFRPLAPALAHCVSGVSRGLSGPPPGFDVVRVTCREGEVTRELRARAARPLTLLARHGAAAVPAGDGRTARERLGGGPEGLSLVTAGGPFPGVRDVIDVVTQAGETLRATVSVGVPQPLPIDPATGEPPRFAQTLAWAMEARIPPRDWSYLEGLADASRLTALSYEPATRTYRLEVLTHVAP